MKLDKENKDCIEDGGLEFELKKSDSDLDLDDRFDSEEGFEESVYEEEDSYSQKEGYIGGRGKKVFLYREVGRRMVGAMVKNGCKVRAVNIFVNLLRKLELEFGMDGSEVFLKSLDNIRPFVYLESRKIAGTVYQIPRYLCEVSGYAVAIRRVLRNIKLSSVGSKNFSDLLFDEFCSLYKGTSRLIRSHLEYNELAIKNRVFIKTISKISAYARKERILAEKKLRDKGIFKDKDLSSSKSVLKRGKSDVVTMPLSRGELKESRRLLTKKFSSLKEDGEEEERGV